MSKFFLNLLRLEAVRNHNDPQVARTLIHHGMFARVRFSVTVRAVIAYRWWKRASFRELLFFKLQGGCKQRDPRQIFRSSNILLQSTSREPQFMGFRMYPKDGHGVQ